MKRQWAYSLVASSLLLMAPLTLNAREPQSLNPCRDLERDLDDQVNTLHQRQDIELAQCRKTNGKDAQVCRAMKEYNRLELQSLRDQRRNELDRCRGPLSRVRSVPAHRQNESCDTYDRNHDHDRYARDKYPEPPYKQPPYKEPPYKEPPKYNPPHHPPYHDGDGKHHHDSDSGATRNAGNNSSSGSSHSGHDSGSSHSSYGGSGSSSGSSSSHSSGGSSSSSSSGSGSTGAGHSSSSGSSGGSSGGSSSSGSSSSSSSSSSSHDAGGRPK